MQNIERWVRREARAMTRREVITKAIAKQLSWVQAAAIVGVTPRQMRRIRWRVEHYGVDAVMDQRGGRPRRKRTVKRPALRSDLTILGQFLQGPSSYPVKILVLVLNLQLALVKDRLGRAVDVLD
jgi:hypothetical protein